MFRRGRGGIGATGPDGAGGTDQVGALGVGTLGVGALGVGALGVGTLGETGEGVAVGSGMVCPVQVLPSQNRSTLGPGPVPGCWGSGYQPGAALTRSSLRTTSPAHRPGTTGVPPSASTGGGITTGNEGVGMDDGQTLSRRGLLRGLGAAGVLSGCATGPRPAAGPPAPTPTTVPATLPATLPTTVPASPSATPSARGAVRLIGDGSTADTGPQPHQPTPRRLRTGETPPQFVVVSWDGCGETGSRLFTRFLDLSVELGASMTFFLSGIYCLPRRRRALHHPPRHPVGASDIGLFGDAFVRSTLAAVGRAWREGHEIGTHFNGHFCGANGVARWSVPEWHSEIDQAIGFVRTWRTTTGFTDLDPLPFDYERELVGGRSPCLEGAAALRRAAAGLGWRYDSSGTAQQVWPRRLATGGSGTGGSGTGGSGLWDLSMPSVPFPGHSFEVLAMDYNAMANQSGGPRGDVARRPVWKAQFRDALLAGFDRAVDGNRAPLVIGNHFEQWNGGIYLDAVEEALRTMAHHPATRFVSLRQLVDWLEAQDRAVLDRLRTLRVGQAPPGGWATFLGHAASGSARG